MIPLGLAALCLAFLLPGHYLPGWPSTASDECVGVFAARSGDLRRSAFETIALASTRALRLHSGHHPTPAIGIWPDEFLSDECSRVCTLLVLP